MRGDEMKIQTHKWDTQQQQTSQDMYNIISEKIIMIIMIIM